MSVHMNIQKVYKNGNSLSMTIPQPLTKALGIREGSKIIIEPGEREFRVIPHKKTKAQDVNVPFMKMVDEFMNDHQAVLKELAKR